MNILTAPFYCFFSRDFYRQVSERGLKYGVTYLLYLSFLISLLFLVLMVSDFLPQMDRYMIWLQGKMPVLTLTSDGLKMNENSPLTLVHPQLGPMITFDMRKPEIRRSEMGKVPVFVTSKNIYMQQGRELRHYKIADLSANAKKSEEKIDGSSVQSYYAVIKPIAAGAVLFFVFIGFFVWKIAGAFFYSFLASAFNSLRAQKLSYAQLFNVTIFAMTPAVLFFVIRLVIPLIGRVPFISVLDIGLTSSYLYFAVKMSEDVSSIAASSMNERKEDI